MANFSYFYKQAYFRLNKEEGESMASFYVEEDNIEKNVLRGYLRVPFNIHLRDVEGAEKEIKQRLVKSGQIYYGRLSELITRLHQRYPGFRKGRSTEEVARKVIQQIKRKGE